MTIIIINNLFIIYFIPYERIDGNKISNKMNDDDTT